MARQPQKPRIAITPTPELRALLEELSKLSGQSLSACAAELLAEIVPVVRGQIDALKAIASRPDQSVELMQEYANAKMHEIAQASLEFSKGEKKRRGKDAAS